MSIVSRPNRRLNIVGHTYGALTVLSTRRSRGKTVCKCECTCGVVKFVWQGNLRNGHTTSCGCRIHAANKHSTHGATRGGRVAPEYRSYSHARARCQNANDPKYPWYGGRGIEFRFSRFEDFLEEVGEKPGPGYSIDRVNNNGHYERGNIRWATAKEQSNNRRPRSRSLHHVLTPYADVVK